MSGLRRKLAAAIWYATLLSVTCMSPMAVSAAPAASPKELSARRFNTGLYAIQRIAISHDGRSVAFLGYMSPSGVSQIFGVNVFDLASGALLARLAVPAARLQILKGGVAFSPDDQTLAAGADIILLWDVKTWHQREKISGPFALGSYAAGTLMNFVFGATGTKIIGLYDRVWAPGDIQVGSSLDSVRLSDGVRQAYRSGNDPEVFQRPEIQVFDVASTARLARFAIARQGQRGDRIILGGDLYMSEDGSAAYVGLIDRDGLPSPPSPLRLPTAAVLRLDLTTGKITDALSIRQQWMFTTFAISPGDHIIATGEREGERVSAAGGNWNTNTDPIRLWAIADDHFGGSLDALSGPVWKLKFLPDAKHLLSCQTGAKDHELLSVWDVPRRTLAAAFALETRAGVAPTCALAPDGGRAVLTLETGIAFGGVRPDTAFIVGLPTSD